MLRRGVALLGTMLLAALVMIVAPSLPAEAEQCPPGTVAVEKEVNGQIIVGCVEDTGGGDGGGGGGGDEGGGGGGGDSDTRECTWRGGPISCGTSTWVWSQANQCYAKVADPQPEADHPAWDGHEPGDGVIIACIAPRTGVDFTCDAADGCGQNINWLWAPNPPGATGPSAIDLARQALASMQLTMGEVGSTPPSTDTDPDSLGVVGTPIWLWVANPAENTTGPITRTASGGGITVSATATLDRVEWALTNDGGVTAATTTCAGEKAPGTAYDGRGIVPSPTCGFQAVQNAQIGHYTITGTAYWNVTWTGGGETGTLSVPGQTNSAPIAIGEIQTIITNG